MQFTASMLDGSGKLIVLYDFLATEISWKAVTELKRAIRNQPEKLGRIVLDPFVRLYEEDITSLAVLTGFLRVAFPGINIELDLSRAHVPYLGMMDMNDQLRFRVVADMINTMDFDKVIVGPAPREALRMLRGNVYMSDFLEDSNWDPDEPKNFDTICYTCAEDHRIGVTATCPSIFADFEPLVACAVGFSGAVADNCIVTDVVTIQRYLGYNYDADKQEILTFKGEALEGRRVLMLARDGVNIAPFTAIAKQLKEVGAAYVGLYVVQSENNTTTTNYEEAEKKDPGSTFIDYVFVDKVDIQ